MRIKEIMETASATATASGNMAVVANPVQAHANLNEIRTVFQLHHRQRIQTVLRSMHLMLKTMLWVALLNDKYKIH